VPWSVPFRAYKTTPPGLHIALSQLPDAGMGVISEVFISKYTWLGEYDGEYLHADQGDIISGYTWTV